MPSSSGPGRLDPDKKGGSGPRLQRTWWTREFHLVFRVWIQGVKGKDMTEDWGE